MAAFWAMVAAASLGAVSALWHLPSLLGPARPFGLRIPAGRINDVRIVASTRRYRVHVVATAVALAAVTGLCVAVWRGSAATIASGAALAITALFAVGVLWYARERSAVAGLVRTWPDPLDEPDEDVGAERAVTRGDAGTLPGRAPFTRREPREAPAPSRAGAVPPGAGAAPSRTHAVPLRPAPCCHVPVRRVAGRYRSG